MNKGLIFTDTEILVDKLGVAQTEIQNLLNQYVEYCSAYIEWNIVDIADPMYADRANSDNWSTYLDILSDYYYGLGLNSLTYCPLFIIGGNEEIPMPLVENPLMIGSEQLYSDMLYCYDYEDASSIPLNILVNQTPRFAVGRLPLSSEHTISDLIDYLNRSIDALEHNIYVRGAAMTTTEAWIPISTEIMRDIPTSNLDGNNVPLNNRMIVSPPLDTVYKEMYEGYVEELTKVDCLLCNLHGSDLEGRPFFVGEDNEGQQSVIALQPSMLKETCPLIFNTLACYGARFIGYAINDSMLYTALQNGTLLYTGACTTAIGGPERTTGYSEYLIKLYNIYLHQGMPAGMALIKAKQDYYRTCHDEEGDDYAMFTILEFNLFGCPTLSMKPKLDINYKPQIYGRNVSTKQYVFYKPYNYVPVNDSIYEADDILAYVRKKVDENLSYIRSKVEKEVYERLGLSAADIQSILYIMMDNNRVGVQFIYTRETQGSRITFNTSYIVNADNLGNITKIFQTK